jgi:hypothetical protein
MLPEPNNIQTLDMDSSLRERMETALTQEADNQELEARLNGSNYAKYSRFVVAALSCLPWVGSILSASASLNAEHGQDGANQLVCQWLLEHRKRIKELEITLQRIIVRVEELGEDAQSRLNDDQYLSLVRQGFQVWDTATTENKKDFVRRTLTNAASTTLCSDDLVRLFLQWIDHYDEIHFKVIRVLFQNRGATRGRIWEEIGNADVREDAAEADLFKLLIHDLSTGHVLRQIRDKNAQGQFLKKSRRGRRMVSSSTMESAFEDTKPYELTEMGSQFATYVLKEVVPRISS